MEPDLMREHARIVILTGAGISAESGLATFRDAGGIWARYDLATVATPEAFAADPDRVYEFYNLRRRDLIGKQPNAAHLALAALQQAHPSAVSLVTQNVDDLHEAAGSAHVIHMHGELRRGWCRACDARIPWTGDMGRDSRCTACGEVGGLRPDIVWFGEIPYHMERLGDLIAACDLFVAIGTSGQVYPAAGFADLAASAGARTLELNLEPTGRHGTFHDGHYGRATDIVPAFVRGQLEAPFTAT
jgi:NAD-dependent deacetylase